MDFKHFVKQLKAWEALDEVKKEALASEYGLTRLGEEKIPLYSDFERIEHILFPKKEEVKEEVKAKEVIKEKPVKEAVKKPEVKK